MITVMFECHSILQSYMGLVIQKYLQTHLNKYLINVAHKPFPRQNKTWSLEHCSILKRECV